MNPVDLFRRDGVTAYSHDVQVDDAGVAWVSGDGGTRGYWTDGHHYDPLERRNRKAHPLKPIPYAGGGLPAIVTNDPNGGFEHNAERPIGKDAPHAPTATATTCSRPRRTSDPPTRVAASRASSASPA